MKCEDIDEDNKMAKVFPNAELGRLSFPYIKEEIKTATGSCIHAVCNAVSAQLADRWIVFPTTAAQRERIQYGLTFGEQETVAEPLDIAPINDNVRDNAANEARPVGAAIVQQYFNH
uniref:(California timema) hypothetical protein n=1 Tax=Timema californicum TaxID=61474 RepID=A0A7R9JEY0_TIMCA|nr:unnamed protein product [Timema californicum]